MRVRLLTGMAWDRRTRRPGEIINLPDDEARRHIAAGQAELVDEDRPRGKRNQKQS